MLEIKTLNSDNFEDFILLLKERGETPEDYYRWKYLNQVSNKFPTGLIAYLDNEPVGCIGNINRIYIDAEGAEHSAIWLCDACISESARQKGVAVSLAAFVSLYKYFSSLSQFRFGIPATAVAQSVMKKSGYFPYAGYYEISVPCLPFKFGFGQYRGSSVICLLRGLKQILLKPGASDLKHIKIIEITDDFTFDFEPRKNILKRDRAYLQWLYLLPQKEANPRKWYKIITEKGWLLIFVEKDYRDVTRARIIDFKAENETEICNRELLLGVRSCLARLGVTFYQAYIHQNTLPDLPKSYIKSLPQYASFEFSANFHVSIADKESGWRDLHFK